MSPFAAETITGSMKLAMPEQHTREQPSRWTLVLTATAGSRDGDHEDVDGSG